jgi:hypothetical protein
MSDKAKNLVRAWQQLRKNRGIIALPEPGWEDWQAVDEAIAVECTVPAPQPMARTAEEKAAKLEELRQSYDCGNMGWSEAVGLYCAWREPKEVPNDEVKSGKYPIARPSPDLLHTIRYLLLSWSVFYTKLPDGDYDGLGEMRTAMANLKGFEAEALPDKCPTCESADPTIHKAYQCGHSDCPCTGYYLHECTDSWHSSVATQKEK